MIEFLKKILGISKTKTGKQKRSRHPRVYQDHDIVDYDGMGNQGRFPAND